MKDVGFCYNLKLAATKEAITLQVDDAKKHAHWRERAEARHTHHIFQVNFSHFAHMNRRLFNHTRHPIRVE